MKRDAHYFQALPYNVSMRFDNDRNQYEAQNMDFVLCRGYGSTPTLAIESMLEEQFKAINTLMLNGLSVPLPRHGVDEAKIKIVWDAATRSLIDSLNVLGVRVRIDATADALTFAKGIVKAIKKSKVKIA